MPQKNHRLDALGSAWVSWKCREEWSMSSRLQAIFVKLLVAPLQGMLGQDMLTLPEDEAEKEVPQLARKKYGSIHWVWVKIESMFPLTRVPFGVPI